jgi:tRNA(fMet)-specific endonuclease VapC
MPWGREAAIAFAQLKLATSREGLGLAPLDLMIAAHALAAKAVLVTNDAALKRAGHWLPVEDWTE